MPDVVPSRRCTDALAMPGERKPVQSRYDCWTDLGPKLAREASALASSAARLGGYLCVFSVEVGLHHSPLRGFCIAP